MKQPIKYLGKTEFSPGRYFYTYQFVGSQDTFSIDQDIRKNNKFNNLVLVGQAENLTTSPWNKLTFRDPDDQELDTVAGAEYGIYDGDLPELDQDVIVSYKNALIPDTWHYDGETHCFNNIDPQAGDTIYWIELPEDGEHLTIEPQPIEFAAIGTKGWEIAQLDHNCYSFRHATKIGHIIQADNPTQAYNTLLEQLGKHD